MQARNSSQCLPPPLSLPPVPRRSALLPFPSSCQCRYGSHTADWAPAVGLYAYGAQNAIVLLNTRAQTVRTLLFGHTGRCDSTAKPGECLAPQLHLVHPQRGDNQQGNEEGVTIAACRVTAVAFAGAAVGARPAATSADADQLPPLLVSAAADRAVRLWNVGTMQRMRALYKRPAEVTAVAVTRCRPGRGRSDMLLLPCCIPHGVCTWACNRMWMPRGPAVAV